ncbi:MAG TPA: isocitrate/isopropylmalate dehydrogenase family protein [Pseudomonas sp.]|nr:isocitrate/isopropylmalate dehydrogenase family protein [Pseudomonas sp.]
MSHVYRIAVLAGDGIGPEVIDAAIAVLDKAAVQQAIELEYVYYDAGADYYRRTGQSIAPESMQNLGDADAVLLGAMGLPDIRYPDGTEIAPQIEIREHYGLFASLRPCKLMAGVPTRIKAEKIDMLVIRETTEGLFAGRHDKLEPSDEAVSDRLTISRKTSEKLFELAFAQARLRREKHGTPGHVTLLDKANVLRSNAFLRKVFDEVALRHPDIETSRLYIDAGSMMFVTNPERYDVVVTENVFGDITSEIGAGIVGGLGVAPSADVSERHGVFQPSHGTAPDIAGQGVANPVAMVLSAAMMLDWLAERNDDERCVRAAGRIRQATEQVLLDGVLARDLGGQATTADVTQAMISALENAHG